MITKQVRRISEIDALRGIAALLVIWLHVAEVYIRIPEIASNGTWLYDIIRWVDLGRLGVSLFFIISGFVICTSIKGEVKEGTLVFTIRRLLRLYPAFWLSVFLGYYVLWVGTGRHLDFSSLLANITMLPVVFGKQSIMGLYWTLELELLFYVLIALLFSVRLLRSLRAILLVAMCCFVIFGFFIAFPEQAPTYAPWKMLPYHLAIMFWGVLFRYGYDDPDRSLVFYRWRISIQTLIILYACSLGVVALSAIAISASMNTWEYVNDGTAYLLAVLIFAVVMKRFPIRSSFMAWLGTISYSLYLFHPVVFRGIRQVVPSHWLTFHLGVYIVSVMLLSIGLAALIYYLIEKPCINLSYRLTKRKN